MRCKNYICLCSGKNRKIALYLALVAVVSYLICTEAFTTLAELVCHGRISSGTGNTAFTVCNNCIYINQRILQCRKQSKCNACNIAARVSDNSCRTYAFPVHLWRSINTFLMNFGEVPCFFIPFCKGSLIGSVAEVCTEVYKFFSVFDAVVSVLFCNSVGKSCKKNVCFFFYFICTQKNTAALVAKHSLKIGINVIDILSFKRYRTAVNVFYMRVSQQNPQKFHTGISCSANNSDCYHFFPPKLPDGQATLYLNKKK